MIRFHRSWAAIALLLLGIEVVIAVYVRDNFVRPYIGDTLVVPLIFSALLAVFRFRPGPLALAVFIFAAFVEVSQAFGLVRVLGLSGNQIARVVLGSVFQWGDFIAYAVGSVLSVLLARCRLACEGGAKD